MPRMPAARLTDLHTCPMATGPAPHVGGPIIGVCAPTVLIGGLPSARIGDQAICCGPPDTVARGSRTVFTGGRPASRINDGTVHGGVIVVGWPTVLIGDDGGAGAGARQAQAFAAASRAGTPFVEACPG